MAKNGDIILIAVDASSYAEEAFKWYFEHMHKPENTLILAHCVEMPSVPSRDTWEAQTKAGREKGQELQNRFSSRPELNGVTVKYLIDFEKPGDYIVSAARAENADVIIMGTRGMGKLRRTIMGSVSNFVLNHASCPVLICRSEKK